MTTAPEPIFLNFDGQTLEDMDTLAEKLMDKARGTKLKGARLRFVESAFVASLGGLFAEPDEDSAVTALAIAMELANHFAAACEKLEVTIED
jgi:hypothetical protein